ncbi:MAG: amidohydrolase family protein [Actinomycetota bacterium]|nr:amidohydrolase family protein [Actinomycetota bacterium]
MTDDALDILDIWVNLVTPQSAAQFLGGQGNAHIPTYLGGDGSAGVGVDDLIGLMDEMGVATGILTPGLYPREGVQKSLAIADAHPGRFLVAAVVVDPGRPSANVKLIREYAQHTRFAMVRVAPLSSQVATDDAKHYPVYQACEEAGIAVAINVGIPGPRVRSRVQHPELLEDVMIDFPDLVIIGAHMGHPYEELLMNYMRKWPNLYLSCTAYAPRYMDPNLVAFMNTSTYRGRVIWGSDEPWFPMRRSLAEAKALPLDDEAMALFLGGTARRLLDRTER